MNHNNPICLFSATLHIGGAERLVVHLARALCRLGIPTDIVLGAAEGQLLDELPPDVNIVDLQAKRIALAVPRFSTYLRRNKPTGIIAMLTHVNLAAIAARALARSPARLCVCECGVLSAATRQGGHPFSRLLPWLARSLYPLAHAQVAVSKATADDMTGSYGFPRGNIHVVTAPVDVEWIRSRAEAPVDHPWFTHPDIPVILGVGRMAKEKDFPTLVRAFEVLRRKRPLRLALIGDGNQRAIIEQEIARLGVARDVWIPGFDPNPFRFMARGAATVAPSAWEAGAYSLLESMALGIPVVGTRCPGGVADFLGNGTYGPLATPGDAGSLAECIEQALGKPVPSHILRSHAETFSPDRILRRYLELVAPGYLTAGG